MPYKGHDLKSERKIWKKGTKTMPYTLLQVEISRTNVKIFHGLGTCEILSNLSSAGILLITGNKIRERAILCRHIAMKSVSSLVVAVCMVAFVEGSSIQNVVEVRTPSGWVRGYEEIYKEEQVYRFIKIPYAQPPVGELRFQKTRPIKEWTDVKGIRDINAPQCPQIDNPIPGMDKLENDEDCLYLNVYVPGKISKDKDLSVMVWIHGGGFITGGASQYKPQKIVVGGGVIVVTINYRLGLLGFLTLHDPLVPGNYGLWDQIQALRWIQDNIAAFGGNPKSVTIFGESAGGMSVSLQTLIPSNEGLFQRAISQSGVVSFYALARRKAEKHTNELLLKKTNCDRGNLSETLKCLRELPVDNITN
uniref:Carboxylic ester hydrolase n=1 Tax=Magallana gigas TaxID=29159 RepID=A0A8W8J4H2_MAGGI